jgi:hypothetical protein
LSYADANGGRFPAGGKTPEASLSLLYPKDLTASVLRGKTYPEGPAKQLLEGGEPLTPETCGWQYVEGLSTESAEIGNIALFWDKFGSDHFSGLLPHGGHSVTFASGYQQVIREADWPRFITEQEKALTSIRRGETPSPPWVPDEEN